MVLVILPREGSVDFPQTDVLDGAILLGHYENVRRLRRVLELGHLLVLDVVFHDYGLHILKLITRKS